MKKKYISIIMLSSLIPISTANKKKKPQIERGRETQIKRYC